MDNNELDNQIKLFLSQRYNTSADAWFSINAYTQADGREIYVYENVDKPIALVHMLNGSFYSNLYDKKGYLYILKLEKQFNPHFIHAANEKSINAQKNPDSTLEQKHLDVSHINKIETQHCKEFLKQEFPETFLKEWKRKRKYKNDAKQTVREFEHPTHGVVILIESNNTLIMEVNDKSLVSGNVDNNFIFGYFDPGSELSISNGFFIMICDKNYWKTHKSIDPEIEFDLATLFPASQQPCDIDESGLLAVDWTGDKASLTAYLLSLGFSIDKEFLKVCDEQSATPVNIELLK